MKELKSMLKAKIDESKDETLLNKAFAIMHEEELSSKITEVLAKKGFNKNSIYRDFESFILGSKSSLQEKFKFLEETLDNGFVIESKLTSMTSPTHVSKIVNPKVPVITDILKEMVVWTNKEMDKTGVGAGEAFLIMGIKSGKKAPQGDVVTANGVYELKSTNKKGGGSGARFKGQGSHWGTTPAYFKTFIENMKKLENGTPIDKDKNAYNLTGKGITNFNKFFKANKTNDKVIIALLKDTVRGVYLSAKPADMKWVESTVKGGQIKDNFITEFAVFQYKYYMSREDFDGVIFTNGASLNFLWITTPDKLKKAIVSKHIKVDASWNWHQAQNNTYQLGVI